MNALPCAIGITADEQAAVVTLGDRMTMMDTNFTSVVSEEMLVQFLMARKFDVDRAFELAINSVRWRRDNGITLYQPLTQTIARELKTKKFVIPPMSTDREGSQVVYYRPGMAKKKHAKGQEFCLSVFYLLQNSIQDPIIQRKGFILVCDLRGTKLLQVDRKLVKSMVDMLSNKFPARLKKVILLEPPSFFSVAFRLVRPLIPSKYIDKLCTARLLELQAYVEPDKLLTEYGGMLLFDPIAYVDTLYTNEQLRLQQQPQVQASNKINSTSITSSQIGAANF